MGNVPLLSASYCYVAAGALYVALWERPRPRLAHLALAGVGLGFLLQAAAVSLGFYRHGYTPVTRSVEALALLGWLLAGAFLVVERSYKLPALGALAVPLAAALVLPAAVLPSEGGRVPDAVKIAGMPVHVLVSFAGIALLALAAGLAVAYLLLERQMKAKRFGLLFAKLPPLEVLDAVGIRLAGLGFVALSMTLVSGMLLAKRAWGSYWKCNPKLMLCLASWAVLAWVLQARIVAGWRGRRSALLTVIGFALLLGSFVGIRLLSAGVHVWEPR